VAPSTTSGLYSRVVPSTPEEYIRGPITQELCSRVAAAPSTQEVYSELGTDSSGVSSGSGSPSPAPRRLNPGWEDLAGAPWYQAGMPRLVSVAGLIYSRCCCAICEGRRPCIIQAFLTIEDSENPGSPWGFFPSKNCPLIASKIF
jgi:hypothetical protein